MKVLVLSGGFRGGNTDLQRSTLTGHLQSSNIDVESIDVADLEIKHCRGCNCCSEGRGCVYKDDMKTILNAFSESDVIIFMSPLRFNGPSSVIKTVIDRFQEVWNNPSVVEHKKRYMSVMMNCGSDNPDLKPVKTIFRSFCYSFGGEWAGEYVSKSTDSTKENLANDVISSWNEIYSIISKDM